MRAICGYCDALVGDDAPEHFREQHPGMEWDLATWPDGAQVLLELEAL